MLFLLPVIASGLSAMATLSPHKTPVTTQSATRSSVPYSHIYDACYKQLTLSSQAFAYLKNVRKLSKATIHISKIRSMENTRTCIQNMLDSFPESDLLESGLVKKDASGNLCLFCPDNSLIFPYFDQTEACVYLSARSYLTKEFRKLSGVAQYPYVHKWGADSYFVFESILDLLAFHELTGFENLISLNGLAGIQQLPVLLPTAGFTYCFDNDAPGIKAQTEHGTTIDAEYTIQDMTKKYNQDSSVKDFNELLIQIKNREIPQTNINKEATCQH